MIETTRLIESTIQAWGDKCYGPMSSVPEDKVMSLDDGQVLDLGGRELEILHTPGHAPHHIAIFDRLTRALFPGDTAQVGLPGRDRGHHDIRPPLFDLAKFLQSLHRLRALKPSVSFNFGGVERVCFVPDNLLKWAEENHLAIERICREGMKQKLSFKEIDRRVEEYETSVGALEAGQRGGPALASGGLFGLIAYIKRMDPSLEMPAGSTALMR